MVLPYITQLTAANRSKRMLSWQTAVPCWWTGARHLWPGVKYCEWHTGHTHAKKKKEILTVDEHVTVRERVIPSLCPIDAWHSRKGYNHIREAQGFIWNKNKGNTGIINYTY